VAKKDARGDCRKYQALSGEIMKSHRSAWRVVVGVGLIVVCISIFLLTTTRESLLFVNNTNIRLAIALLLGALLLSGIALVACGQWICIGNGQRPSLKNYAVERGVQPLVDWFAYILSLAIHLFVYVAAAFTFVAIFI
jgi:hypothetical protein